jgi:hypothetical protein
MWRNTAVGFGVRSSLPCVSNGIQLRIRPGASTSPLRGYAQHERFFSARPERTLSLSKGKSKDEQNANLIPLPVKGEEQHRTCQDPDLGVSDILGIVTRDCSSP